MRSSSAVCDASARFFYLHRLFLDAAVGVQKRFRAVPQSGKRVDLCTAVGVYFIKYARNLDNLATKPGGLTRQFVQLRSVFVRDRQT